MKENLKKISILVIFLILVLLFFSLKKTYKEYTDQSKINSNAKITNGYITDYYEIESVNYLEYHYTVDGAIYSNEVSSNLLYKKCKDDHSCINKKIYVKYYANDPSISIPILDTVSN